MDWYGEYPKGKMTNPAGPTGPNKLVFRVHRGGSNISFADFCRSAFRSGSNPGGGNLGTGFRIELAPALPEREEESNE